MIIRPMDKKSTVETKAAPIRLLIAIAKKKWDEAYLINVGRVRTIIFARFPVMPRKILIGRQIRARRTMYRVKLSTIATSKGCIDAID